MKVLRIRCHCGRNLADCVDERIGRTQLRNSLGRPEGIQIGDHTVHYPGALASPDQHPNLIVVPRPGIEQRHHQPAGQVLTYTWTCSDCARRPPVRAHRVAALYAQHRSEPRRVVYVQFGIDL